MALASDAGGGLTGELNRNPTYNSSTLLNNHLNADNENPLNPLVPRNLSCEYFAETFVRGVF
jgi:hypothetical protein